MDDQKFKQVMKEQNDFFVEIIKQQKQWMCEIQKKYTTATVSPQIEKFRRFEKENESWETYIFQLKQHFLAGAVTDVSLQRASFLSSVGADTVILLGKLYGNELEKQSFDTLCAKLSTHFVSKKHVLAARCDFNKTLMKAGQTYGEWVAELRGVARDCDFVCAKAECKTTFVDSLIRDMIVLHTPHDPVRAAALQKVNPTLEEVLQIATGFESTQKSFNSIKGEAALGSVNQIKSQRSRGRGRWSRKSSRRISTDRSGHNVNFGAKKSCPKCEVNHPRSKCFHRESICDYCGKQGHIVSVCYRSRSRGHYRSRCHSQNHNRNTSNVGKADSSYSVQPIDNHELEGFSHQTSETIGQTYVKSYDYNSHGYIHTVTPPEHALTTFHKFEIGKPIRFGNRIFIVLNVNNVNVRFQMDSGATCSMVGSRGYAEMGSPKVTATNKVLCGYNNSPLRVLGQAMVRVRQHNKIYNLPVLVTNCSEGENLMGMDWFDVLNFGVSGHVMQVSSTMKLQSDIKGLCQEYNSLFDNSLGLCKTFQAHLEIKENIQPRYYKPRPIPFASMEKVKEEIRRLEDNGILKPVKFSSWATPLVLVTKPNNKIRICGDFKITVNPNIEVDRYPIPRVKELFHRLQGGVKFSKIDLKDAYLQIELDDESKKLVVINTPFGLYEYQRMPFGIASAPSIFQRFMEQIIAGLPHCAAYQDDIIISGRDDAEHIRNLRELFNRLQENGLHCSLEKCQFAQSAVEYLGHKIDAEGIRPTEGRLEAIAKMPRPQSVKDVEAFIGKLN